MKISYWSISPSPPASLFISTPRYQVLPTITLASSFLTKISKFSLLIFIIFLCYGSAGCCGWFRNARTMPRCVIIMRSPSPIIILTTQRGEQLQPSVNCHYFLLVEGLCSAVPLLYRVRFAGCRAGLLCFCIFPSGQSAPMCVPLEPHSNRRRHYIYDGFPPCSYILMVTFVILSAIAQLMPSAVAQQKKMV